MTKDQDEKPFKLRKERNGNTYIEVTVKHGWNKCCDLDKYRAYNFLLP